MVGKSVSFSADVRTVENPLTLSVGRLLEETGDRTKAKQCYNQAFIVSAEIENKQLMVQLQKMIQDRLSVL